MFPAAAEHLMTVTVPSDNDGDTWSAAYTILQVLRQPAGPWRSNPVGTVRIRRLPGKSGSFEIHAEVLHALGHGLNDRYVADITSRDDATRSLIGWRREELFHATQPGLKTSERRADTGAVVGGRLIRRPGGRSRERFGRANPIVAQWALFDAVRRLDRPIAFAMLEDMDVIRLNQSLRPLDGDPVVVAAEQGPVPLRCVVQTGDGILPITWWLGPSGLPLMVLSNCRAFVLNPDATLPEMPS